MKKEYNKPEILFENFCSSTSIAGDCEARTNNPSNNSGCHYYFTGVGNVFLNDMGVCVIKATNDGINDGYYTLGNNTLCYHVPLGSNVFNS